MPSLINKPLPEVERIVVRHGLLLIPTHEWVHNDDPRLAGRVAEQTPEAGLTVAVGDEVRVAVHAHPEMVRVTDYTGRPYRVAEAGLSAAGFTVIRTDIDSHRPAGEVLRQTPNRGEAVKGSDVVLEVSTGADEPITMPRLIGKTDGEARSLLHAAGHTGQIQVTPQVVDSQNWDGKITSTAPNGGDTVAKSDTVTLYVGEYTDPGNGIPEQSPPTAQPTQPPPTGPTTPTPDPSGPRIQANRTRTARGSPGNHCENGHHELTSPGRR